MITLEGATVKPVFQRSKMAHQVAEHLAGLISREKRAGDRLESERDLSKTLGVSLPTVREALGMLEHRGMVERRHGSGTYVLDGRDQRQVAVLMELDIGHPRISYFYTRMVQTVRLRLEAKGHRVRFYNGHTPPGEPNRGITCRDFLEDVRAGRISAVAAIALAPFEEWIRPVQEQGIPAVGGEMSFPYGPILDHGGALLAGVQRLAREGRRRLALLGTTGPEPLRLMRQALEAEGLSFVPGYVPDAGSQPASPGLGWRLFRQVWEAEPQKPDGLLVMDDFLFQDAAMAILDAGLRVPRDLSIVTLSNKGSSIHYPFPVVRLENDPDAFAEAYVGLVDTLVRKEPVREPHIRVPFRVVEPAEEQEAARPVARPEAAVRV